MFTKNSDVDYQIVLANWKSYEERSKPLLFEVNFNLETSLSATIFTLHKQIIHENTSLLLPLSHNTKIELRA